MEKLTKWSDPINSSPLARLGGPLAAKAASSAYIPIPRRSRWQSFKVEWHKPYHKSILKRCLPYTILVAFNATMLFTIPNGHPHAISTGSLGFSIGMLFMTLLYGLEQKSSDSLRETEKYLDRMVMEAEIRDEYEKNYAP